jgi:hypothetical protein
MSDPERPGLTSTGLVLCACGRPLHYTDPEAERHVTELVAKLGPLISVTVTIHGRIRQWKVPRHFIALHGLKAKDLPTLAQQYHFREVTG